VFMVPREEYSSMVWFFFLIGSMVWFW